jgi:hypothetical protein
LPSVMRNNWLRGELCVMWWPRWSKKQKKEAGERGMRDERADDAQRLIGLQRTT